MTDTLARHLCSRLDPGLGRPTALLEVIEIDELIVIPGVDALLDAPGEFSLDFDISIRLSGMLRKHAHRVGLLKRMTAQSLSETRCGADYLKLLPASLPVRALGYLASDERWAHDPQGLAALRIAFAFVAVHALTDPTDCGTASRSLNLRPRPLHDDRALLCGVLARALPDLDDGLGRLLVTYVSKASAFFAAPDTARWSLFGGPDAAASSLLDYNPDALRLACRAIGWPASAVRIADRY